jgi:hypothetical protein
MTVHQNLEFPPSERPAASSQQRASERGASKRVQATAPPSQRTDPMHPAAFTAHIPLRASVHHGVSRSLLKTAPTWRGGPVSYWVLERVT